VKVIVGSESKKVIGSPTPRPHRILNSGDLRPRQGVGILIQGLANPKSRDFGIEKNVYFS